MALLEGAVVYCNLSLVHVICIPLVHVMCIPSFPFHISRILLSRPIARSPYDQRCKSLHDPRTASYATTADAEAAGLVVFFDFVTALPWQASQCLLVYALYDGARPVDSVKALPPTECEPEPGGFTRALLAADISSQQRDDREASRTLKPCCCCSPRSPLASASSTWAS